MATNYLQVQHGRDASAYVSQRVFDGVRTLKGANALAQRKRAALALARAKKRAQAKG